MPAQAQTGPTAVSQPGPGLLLVRLLLLVALMVDGYLSGISLTNGTVAGCGPASNCHVVLTSRWAYWLGIPVSVFGLLVYASLLGASFLVGAKTAAPQRKRAWQLLVLGSALILGAGVWFISLQFFVIKTICPFCMTAHTCAMLAAALLLMRAPIQVPAEKSKQKMAAAVYVPPALARKLYLAAAGALAIFIGGQSLYAPLSYDSTPIAAGVTTTNTAASPARQFQIFDGRFQFNLDQVPLYGRSSAAHAMVSLFDYTCHHCREMHTPLMEAHHRFSNELAIVSLPMPLDAKCNPIVKRTQTAHTNACALARIGLAVWLANRQVSAKFDDWVFEPEHPPQPESAERYARELVGAAAFDRAITNQWVDQQIQQDVAIYEAVYRRFKKGYMPEVIIGTNLISGTFRREQLFQMLSDQFGLKEN